MPQATGHLISRVEVDSIAEDLGLQPGDRVLLIDDQPLRDIFDFRLRQLSSKLVLTVLQGESTVEYEIEKDDEEELGLEFENPLLEDCSQCHNHCVFCFIDQLPRGLRPSLYFKDDDLRMSFLSGNYATLTNISDVELDRLIAYRFSPMNISVHTTDEKLRLRMMRHPASGNILARLKRIAAAGLDINCQMVLCPGLNDGQALESSLDDLTAIGQSLRSIALVPVGLTRFRKDNGLFKLNAFTPESARQVLQTVEDWQSRMLEQRGTRLVYAADEFFLKAGRPIPPADYYEDFPQLENGVGMAALMLSALDRATGHAGLTNSDSDDSLLEPTSACEPLWSFLPRSPRPVQPDIAMKADETSGCDGKPTVLLATGTAAAALLQPYAERLSLVFRVNLHILSIVNTFFGETITVAGLLTGQDLIRQLADLSFRPDCLILPSCMLKADEPVFLDDLTVQDVAESLNLPVHVGTADGQGLLGLLAWIASGQGGNDHE